MKVILIGIISILYIRIIYPYIILILTQDIHNFLLIFVSLLINLENIILEEQLKNKINDNIMEDKYLKIISNQISYICRSIDNLEIKQKKILRSKSLNNI